MAYGIIIVIAAIFQAVGTKGLLLCDGDCINNTDLDTGLNICTKINDSRKVITLLGLFPCNSEVFRARGLTPAAQMAIYQINENSDNSFLPGFRLQLLVNNSMVSYFIAMSI